MIDGCDLWTRAAQGDGQIGHQCYTKHLGTSSPRTSTTLPPHSASTDVVHAMSTQSPTQAGGAVVRRSTTSPPGASQGQPERRLEDLYALLPLAVSFFCGVGLGVYCCSRKADIAQDAPEMALVTSINMAYEEFA